MRIGLSRVVAAVSRVAPDGGQYHGTHRVMFSHIKVGQVRRCDLFAAWAHIKGENYPEPKPGKLTLKGIFSPEKPIDSEYERVMCQWREASIN